jgi:hypothetical protein
MSQSDLSPSDGTRPIADIESCVHRPLMRWGGTTLSIVSVLVLSGCGPQVIRPINTQITSRVQSSDGALEAVYANDIGGGAAVGATEEVFVVKTGTFPKLRERVFSDECVHNLSARWIAPRDIAISYDIASDLPEHSHPYRPSPLTFFSGAYWTFSHPHGVQVHFERNLTAPSAGC